jgi:uncharacterized protein YcnI
MPGPERPRDKEIIVKRTRILPVALSAGLVAALGGVAQAVNIPDGGTVEPDRVGLIHFRITEGCEGLPTDSLEVTIPEGLTNIVPEAVAGWTVETETVDRGGDPEISMVRWTGGPLEDGQLLEFGLRATFPEDGGLVLTFPAVQTCGTTAIDWSGEEGSERPAPTVRVTDRVGALDLIALNELIGEMNATLEDIDSRMGDVDAPNLRSRVTDLETALEDLTTQLEELTERLDELEAAPAS